MPVTSTTKRRRATRSTSGRAKSAADSVGGSRAARIAARAGLVARTGFYALLTALVIRVAIEGGGGQQTNAHGALALIAGDPVGMALIAATALGFFAFGVVRLAGALRDRAAGARQRLLTAAQGGFYLALTWVPVAFLLGNRQTGSEQAQRQETAAVLSWPGGRYLVIAIGLVVVAVCGFQIRQALTQDFETGMDLRSAPRWVCRAIALAGSVGIAARALVFLPIGVFLVVAAVQYDPQHAKGIDAELALLAGESWWGPAILALVAAGLAVFTVYSGLEARYRKVGQSS